MEVGGAFCCLFSCDTGPGNPVRLIATRTWYSRAQEGTRAVRSVCMLRTRAPWPDPWLNESGAQTGDMSISITISASMTHAIESSAAHPAQPHACNDVHADPYAHTRMLQCND